MLQEGDGKTVLRVPLRTADRVIGFISLWESRGPRAWSEREIRLVEAVAAHTSVALANAHSYAEAQSRTRELEALYNASRRLNSSLSVNDICQVCVEALLDSLGYDHVAVYLISGDEFRLQIALGYPETIKSIPVTKGVMGRAARARQPLLVDNVTGDTDYIPAINNIRSEIAVPLIHNGQVLGVLNVETLAPRCLSAADVRLLTTFGYQLTIAIDNARLFEETRQRLIELETLHEASQALNADLTLDAVLNRVADYFLALLAVDTCSILRWDGASEELYILLDRDPNPRLRLPPGTHFRAADSYYTRLMMSDMRPHSFRRDTMSPDADMAAALDRFQWSSLLALPLLGKGELIGMLELGVRERARDFSSDEIRLAESLANQAAIAIENARLYAEAERRLRETESLYRFTATLGQVTKLPDLAWVALDSIAQLIHYDFGGMAIVDDVRGMIVPLMMTGPGMPLFLGDRAQPLSAEPVPEPGAGIVRWVVEHGETVRLGNVGQDPRYLQWASDIQSELCVPMRAGERILGAINLESRESDAFDEHAEQLLITFANQFAIAIVNLKLYDRTRHEAEVKAALLRELSHRVKNNLAAIAMLLQLALYEGPEAREEILKETLARAQSMVTAHNLLAHSANARVKLVELGEQVLKEAALQLAPQDKTIKISAHGDPIEIAPRQLTTLALILNELATNSVLHGFAGDHAPRDAEIELQVRAVPSGVRLILSDNGKGLPGGPALASSSGLGLDLVRTLAEKDLHGSFTLEWCNGWTVATIQFALED